MEQRTRRLGGVAGQPAPSRSDEQPQDRAVLRRAKDDWVLVAARR